MPLSLMYIANDLDVVRIAQNGGVDRIFVDLEVIGKAERQKGSDCVLSKHTLADVAAVREVVATAKLLTRVNPIHDANPQKNEIGSPAEIEGAIQNGSDLLMLPMFKTPEELEKFVELTAGRARTVALLETKEAVERIDEILAVRGVDEYYVGLNDLSRGYNKEFLFELLADGTVDAICDKLRAAGKPFGLGGLARLEDGAVKARRVLAELYRLGSSSVILSRSFCDARKIVDKKEIELIFSTEVPKIRRCEEFLATRDAAFFAESRATFRNEVEAIAAAKRAVRVEQTQKAV